MSRSFKKTPIHGITMARSEKSDKAIANRKLRRAVKRSINLHEEIQPLVREVSSVWTFSKDGKRFFIDGELMRK